MVEMLFGILLIASCSYAFIAGGKEGRCVSLLIVAAALLSIPAGYLDRAWSHTQLPVLAVDLALLVALTIVSVRSHRFWPLWMTGFHFASILTHLATIGAPAHFKPMLYFAMQSFWSLPLLLVMVTGIMRDRQAIRAGRAGIGNAGKHTAPSD